jgi:hypothetical protein
VREKKRPEVTQQEMSAHGKAGAGGGNFGNGIGKDVPAPRIVMLAPLHPDDNKRQPTVRWGQQVERWIEGATELHRVRRLADASLKVVNGKTRACATISHQAPIHITVTRCLGDIELAFH